jgi:hypothetical protein
LYEPMKELDDKFPEWLEKNGSKCGADDLKRYKEQQVFVREIVGKFEEKGYKDENAKDREYIVERMQKVRFHILSKRGNMLMGDRCKRLVLRHQILLVIWRQLRKHLGRLKKGVHSNEEALSLFLDRVT